MGQTLLFIGAMLVVFQYVGDIGYASTLFSMPFALPIRPLLEKATQHHKRGYKSIVIQIAWWMLLTMSATIFVIISIVLSPIMLVYLFVGRPLLYINKLLNRLYEKSITPWQDVYSIILRVFLRNLKVEKEFTDEELWEIRKQKGELPFIAFIGLLCIVAGFILQLL